MYHSVFIDPVLRPWGWPKLVQAATQVALYELADNSRGQWSLEETILHVVRLWM